MTIIRDRDWISMGLLLGLLCLISVAAFVGGFWLTSYLQAHRVIVECAHGVTIVVNGTTITC